MQEINKDTNNIVLNNKKENTLPKKHVTKKYLSTDDLEMLRENKNHKNSRNTCDSHIDGA